MCCLNKSDTLQIDHQRCQICKVSDLLGVGRVSNLLGPQIVNLLAQQQRCISRKKICFAHAPG